jgi:eukaryotic-like serine/threonine-protein kinase
MTDITERLSAALAGRYRIERHLGEGGMASVYLAEDLKHDRKVAVKVLKPELAAVLGAERFVVEIKTTASLQHPHILPLFDSGTADGFLFYVMPFIKGETLRDKLNRETQLGVDEAVRIAREVADALDYAHRSGVIHRDIKPENILLHDGRPMVADFGIALAVSAAAGGRMTETGLSLGTPHYMSPEQATAEKEISARSDIYSIGSVLYEMLTGEPPHSGGSAQQVIMKIITDQARPVTELRKSVPPNVEAAVAKAIEKLPADRFESAKAFADALVNPGFRSTAAFASTASMAGRRGVPIPMFAATTTIAVAAVLVAVWAWQRETPAVVSMRVAVALPEAQALEPTGNLARAAISPDGRTVVYVGAGEQPGSVRLWRRQLDELNATPLPRTEAAGSPSFSPDGRHIAFVSETPRALKAVPIDGGPVVVLADSAVDLGGVSWSDDGYIYYDGKLEGDGLARVRATGGKPEIVTVPDREAGERFHSKPSALPDGRGVIFTQQRATGSEVAAFDARTRKHSMLVRAQMGVYAASGHLVYVTIEGTMMAVPFDLDRLAISGDAVVIAEGVSVPGANARGVTVSISGQGLMAYIAGDRANVQRELVWVSRDGTAIPVDTSWATRFIGRPELSPDARRVAITVAERVGTGHIWVKELDRGPQAKLEGTGASPTWSPDGRFIAFSSPQGMMRGPVDGSALPTPYIPNAGPLNTATLEWSRDGKWLVYARQNHDLVAVRTDTDTTVHELLVTRWVERQPSLSPDGRWLAYISDETGRYEVYVRPFPDTRVTKRQVSLNGGFAPRWSRDGRELFFVDETVTLFAVPISPGPVFTPGSPQRLFNAFAFNAQGASYDVHPDGKRFLMTRAAGAAALQRDELVIVQNFFQELRTKVPR